MTRSGPAGAQRDDFDGDGFDDRGFDDQPLRPEPGLAESRQFDARPSPVATPKSQWKRALPRRIHGVSFAGLFLFMFFIYFRPYELSQHLDFLKNAAFWIAVLTIAIFLPTQMGLEKKRRGRQPEVFLVLALLLAALLSIPGSLDTPWAWTSWIEYSKVVVMFVVMVNVVRTEKRLRALLYLALVASCVMATAAVNDYRLGRLLESGLRIEGVIGGLFSNPNDLALHLVTMIPLAVGLFFASKGPAKKLIFAGCAVLFITGVVATFSRGGFVGLVCIMAALAWKLARKNRILFAIGGLGLVLVVVVAGPGGYQSRVTEGTDASAVARTGELKRSVFLMTRHPLFGLGMNNFILFSNTSHASHNAYTQVGSELGIPAMVIYILFLITPLKRLGKVRRQLESTRSRGRYYYLSVGIEASLIGYMVTSFFLSVAYLWYVYFLVGYAIALRRLSEESPELPVTKSTAN
ncbi:MAG: O-antigen polymerase [Acidobacteria bacterium]|nr:O-antigen polymerase [Acidobacteriota bacterium]